MNNHDLLRLPEDEALSIIHEDSKEALRALLVNARKSRGLSQARLGEMAGITQPAISKIENAKVDNISFDHLQLVSLALGYTITVHPTTMADIKRGDE